LWTQADEAEEIVNFVIHAVLQIKGFFFEKEYKPSKYKKEVESEFFLKKSRSACAFLLLHLHIFANEPVQAKHRSSGEGRPLQNTR
jgi:hypothetical protein